MVRYVFLVAAWLVAVSVGAQTTGKSKNQPREEVKVNKQFDEQGNLVGYDSTYVYSWSSDSTLQAFPPGGAWMDFFGKNNFSFGNDSLEFQHPFGMDDFFGKSMDDFFGQFFSPDSLHSGMNFFSFSPDSLGVFPSDSLRHFSFGNRPFWSEFYPTLPDSVNGFDFLPKGMIVPNDSIRNQHQKLFEQHRKEMEEIRKNFFQF